MLSFYASVLSHEIQFLPLLPPNISSQGGTQDVLSHLQV